MNKMVNMLESGSKGLGCYTFQPLMSFKLYLENIIKLTGFLEEVGALS